MKPATPNKPATLKAKLCLVAAALAVIGGVWAANKYAPLALTDHQLSGERSGLIIYTDFYTGCQYIGTMAGGLTERRRASAPDQPDGRHMCLKRNSYSTYP